MTSIDEITERSIALARELEDRLRIGFDEDTAAELALLQLMPFEEDALPLDLCESVLKVNPGHGLATLVRSYLSLHYLMDDEDQRRVALSLRELIGNGIQVGAAALQLDEIRRALNPRAGYQATEALVRKSVEAEPTWTLNHLRLARGFREAQRPDDARREYDLAIANRITNESGLAPLAWSFAACFTGQLMRFDRLTVEREKP